MLCCTLCYVLLSSVASYTAYGQTQGQSTSTTNTENVGSPLLRNLILSTDLLYSVRLVNGDVLVGTIREVLSKDAVAQELQGSTAAVPQEQIEEAIRLEHMLGVLTIFASEILEIIPYGDVYRHSHRMYIMPTAEPIAKNAFIGIWQLFVAYAGFGIAEYVSCTAGRTFLPGVLPQEQATLVNIKLTPFRTVLDTQGAELILCAGGNLALLNEYNPLGHIYAGATLKGKRTSFTAHIFSKLNEPSMYTIRGGNLFALELSYAAGTYGIGLGIDSRFSDRHDVHFIGELWAPDVLRPRISTVLLGLRLGNTSLSMDFGVAIAPQPIAIPFVCVAWTPL
ncbi:MAG: hypothetical protein RML40_10740 [Bacteroidota bacterium]|nr:hypothetical protein [Candidatus Kapabacteria bacterium]MDW8220990.1 hypothetical protein [Bacteroidota bacterium]